jgi:hypothetical protein
MTFKGFDPAALARLGFDEAGPGPATVMPVPS